MIEKSSGNFSQLLQRVFISVQENFDTIQSDFTKLFAVVDVNSRKAGENKLPPGTPNSQNKETPSVNQGTPMNIHIPVITPPPDLGKSPVIGSAVLVLKDHWQGSESGWHTEIALQTPHFGQGQLQSRPEDLANMQHIIAVQTTVNREPVEQLAEISRQQERMRNTGQMKLGRNTPIVKPAKLNIPEFAGQDADSWIQTIEQYFDSARTPLEQRTEIAIAYLKGDAMQWWRGTGFYAGNLPWQRFCRYLNDRFAESSVCDNVRSFHCLTQTSTVPAYIQQFEALLNEERQPCHSK